MNKHTPGPWYVGREDEDTGEIEVNSDAHPYVCLVLPGAIDEVTPANARLIAAAPSMLHTLVECERVLARLDKLRHLDPDWPILDEVRAQIAKATGE